MMKKKQEKRWDFYSVALLLALKISMVMLYRGKYVNGWIDDGNVFMRESFYNFLLFSKKKKVALLKAL